jgi:membrane protein DedA with SNARE-associated domain
VNSQSIAWQPAGYLDWSSPSPRIPRILSLERSLRLIAGTSRLLTGLRAFGTLVAGISCKHGRSFLFYNVLAGVVWVTASVSVGPLFGNSLNLVEEGTSLASLFLVLLLVLTPVFYLAYRQAVKG